MKTLAEVIREELTAIQDFLESGDRLIIEPKDIRLEVMGAPIAIGHQAAAAILEARHAAKD